MNIASKLHFPATPGLSGRGVAYVDIPHLLWVAFATVLQLSITGLNW